MQDKSLVFFITLYLGYFFFALGFKRYHINISSQKIKKTSLQHRLQAQTLPDVSQQIGKSNSFSKFAVNLIPFKILNLLKILVSNRLGLSVSL